MTVQNGYFLVADIAGHILSTEERQRLNHPALAGIILFTRNFSSREQLLDLIASIRAENPQLLIMADQEGGRVQRFRGDGFTEVPAMGRFGQLYQRDSERACALIRETGWLLASELLASGIDLGLAPVLDLDRGISRVVGDRSFGVEPEIVSTLANAYLEGMHEAGMAAVGKHFPGHGGVGIDSHIALPVDRRTAEQLQEDIQPFAALVQAGIDGVMPGHICYPAVDSEAAGFSSHWQQKVLRQQLGFNGVIFSDCLSMAGASIGGTAVERVEKALTAGCDLTLVCNTPDDVASILEAFDNGRFTADRKASQERIHQLLKWRTHTIPTWPELIGSERRQQLLAAFSEL
ncbi:beta-N-acetylhexosaminidase [Parendozoicomonas haliclonae]|uniref:Beta-hexosaminidase n=1 Tax=Parendozoicomonas haliclonae TaxID=1960125 RepID=A0A1X7AMY4_9GAMM|nr:beta-N-acetylhexosaminidase [Parendozoicomonas haliclonae]SMA47780.1 Beta-hexosaminidase [Parendozoicomonas haliclonae]